MPAYFDTGFSVRQPMWHGLGTVTDRYPEDYAEARKWAQLEWEPMKAPLFRRELTIGDDGMPLEQFVEVESHQMVVRDDNDGPLGVVTSGLELVSHKTMGEIIEALVGEGAQFETLISVKGGAQVAATVRVGDAYELGGSDDSLTLPYLVLTNAHDGSGACRAQMVDIRVVCWNTYRAAEAMGERNGRTWSFRHTAGVNMRIEEAKSALKGVTAESLKWRKIAERLNSLHVDDAQVEQYLSLFIPKPARGVVSDRVMANVERDQATFRGLYERSVTTDGHRGTALGLVDASVEYLDHLRGYRNRDTYLGRSLLRSEPLKAQAFTFLADVLDMERADLVAVN